MTRSTRIAREAVRALIELSETFYYQCSAMGVLWRVTAALRGNDLEAARQGLINLADYLDGNGANGAPLRALAKVVRELPPEAHLDHFAAFPEALDFEDYLERAIAVSGQGRLVKLDVRIGPPSMFVE